MPLHQLFTHCATRPRTYFFTALAIALLITGFSFFYFGRANALIRPQIDHLANQLKAVSPATHILKESLLIHPDPGQKAKYLHLDAVLKQKLLDANARALFHLHIAGEIAIIASAQNSMTLTLSATAAFFLFFALRRGLENADRHVLLAFVLCAAGSGAFFAAPSVFELRENFKSNANAYVSLLSVADRIRSYSAASVTPENAATDEFLKNIDRALNDSRALYFQFDISKAPSVSDMLNNFGAKKVGSQ